MAGALEGIDHPEQQFGADQIDGANVGEIEAEPGKLLRQRLELFKRLHHFGPQVGGQPHRAGLKGLRRGAHR